MGRRFRKLSLTPLEGKILWKLEEAGDERLALMLWLRDPATDAASFVVELRAALLGLLRRELVTLEGRPTSADAASCVAGISPGDVFDPARLGELTLVLTPEGRRALST